MKSIGQKKLPRNSWKNPVVLLDRCLPRTFADALKTYGVNAYHIGDIYPNDAKHTEDTEWIADAGERGYIVLTRDLRVQRNSIEFHAVQEYGAKVFAMTAKDAPADVIGLYFGRQLPNIIRRGLRPGPAFWRIRGKEDPTRILK